MLKVLYFDTNAIIKFFVREKGSELIKWIVNTENQALYSLSISTSQIAIYEFKKVIKKKEKRGDITNKQMKGILTKSKDYFRTCFHVRDYRPVPGFRDNKDTNYLELCKKYGLESWDARHFASVINYLRCCAGVSRPRIITADKYFKKAIKAEGYDVIDPEVTTKEEFLSMISS